MSVDKIAYACGFIQTVPSYPSFVVPVFWRSNSPLTWVQSIKDGAVQDFVPSPEGDLYFPLRENVDVRIGSAPIYGFAYGPGHAHFGDEVNMSLHLLENKERLARNPHVLAEAADFFLHFFRSRRSRGDGAVNILDDLVEENGRRVREVLMGVPKSGRRPFVSEVVIAHSISIGEINRFLSSSQSTTHMNLWTLSSMVKWVEKIAPDNRMRWFRRAVEDRFSEATHVVVLGRPFHANEFLYLDVILNVASRGTAKLVRLDNMLDFERWIREQKHTRPLEDSDKRYVANLFELDKAFEKAYGAKGRTRWVGFD
ncbi:hypothetical protein [Burkholderia ubonensis]|uniref:hypothetical protein n=1 Tax=Burkholderia ubonensis TaxID=101571 RepID=UPI000ACFEF94|nr:hypothetical protein [Burkholderia ubonensis]